MKEKNTGFKSVKRSVFVLLLLIVSSLQLFAKDISGVIKDEKGETVIGATVKVKGTTVGTITDFNGVYTLSVPDDAKILEFSYIGMETQEVTISGAKADVVLKDSSKELDAVVISGGYGPGIAKKDLVSTITNISGDELSKHTSAGALDALQGKISGVSITQTEGGPDAEIKVRVRGGTSITSTNDPLYLVDGFPATSINDIPPSSIESIEVMKDASATAIYGSRAANGVVIVTTKGTSSKDEGEASFNVSYNGFVGWKRIANQLDVLSAEDFTLWQYERAVMRGGGRIGSSEVNNDFIKYFDTPGYDAGTAMSSTYYQSIMDQYAGMETNNWQDSIFGNIGTTMNHTLNISGGTKQASYNLNYNRIDDQAIMKLSNFSKDYLDFKLNLRPLKKLKISMKTQYMDQRVNGGGANDVDQSGSSDSRLKHAVYYAPIELKIDPDDLVGEEVSFTSSLINPNEAVADNFKSKRKTRYKYNARVQWDIIKDLQLKVDYGYRKTTNEEYKFYGPTSSRSRENEELPIVYNFIDDEMVYVNSNTLSYKLKDLGKKKKHSFIFLLGEETNIYKFRSIDTYSRHLPEFLTYDNADGYTSSGDDHVVSVRYPYEEKMLSFFGRVNYDFGKKYYITATLRADGSSRFAQGLKEDDYTGFNMIPYKKWGTFPSVAAGWRVSDEKFLSSTKNWLYDLKLRLSYGQVGNSNIDPGSYLRNYVADLDDARTTLGTFYPISDRLLNPALIWETTTTRNVGIDYGLFKNRLSGSIDAYYNTTVDLLLDTDVGGTGYATMYDNIGETASKGLEFSVNANVLQKKNYSLDFNFNIAYVQSEVVSLGDSTTFQPVSSGWAGGTNKLGFEYLVKVGEPVGLINGYELVGRYAADEFKWVSLVPALGIGYWDMNDARYSVVDDNGTPADLTDDRYFDADGNEFVDGETVVKQGWGPGAIKLRDLSGPDGVPDGKIDEDDKTIIGRTLPDFTGGFSMAATYKAFDLSATFSYVIGNDVYNANKLMFTQTEETSHKLKNMTSEMANGKRWTFIDATGEYTAAAIGGDPSTHAGRYVTETDILAAMNATTTMYNPYNSYTLLHSGIVEDGSFLRLNSVTLGCTLPNKWVNKLAIQSLRLYVSATNLFVLTNYSGFDPEVDTRRKDPRTPGVDYSAYPKNQAINVGLNLNF